VALGHPGAAAEALPTVVQLAADGGSPNHIRRLAVEALIGIGDDRAVIVLDGLLAHADPGLRARGATLAARLTARRHTAAVARLLGDGLSPRRLRRWRGPNR
jgi:HEAT repeat protein